MRTNVKVAAVSEQGRHRSGPGARRRSRWRRRQREEVDRANQPRGGISGTLLVHQRFRVPDVGQKLVDVTSVVALPSLVEFDTLDHLPGKAASIDDRGRLLEEVIAIVP